MRRFVLLPLWLGYSVLFSSVAYGQIAFTSVGTGNWNSGTTWSTVPNTPGAWPGDPGRAGSSGDTVTIAGTVAHTVTYNVTAGAAEIVVTTLTFNAGGNNTTLAHGATTLTLHITGNVNINQPTTNIRTILWNIDTGTATVDGSISFLGTNTTNSRKGIIRMSSGTLNANNGISFVGTAPLTKNIETNVAPATAVINLKGNMTGTAGATMTAGTSGAVFNYVGAAAQTFATFGSGAYFHVYFNNSSASGITTSSAITATNVAGDVRVQSGKFTSNNVAITGNATGTFQLAAGTVYEMTGTASFPTGFGTFTLDATSIVRYKQSAAAAVGAVTYGFLELVPTANVTLTLAAGTLGVASDLTVGNGTNTPTMNGNTNDPAISLFGNVVLTSPSVITPSTTATMTFSPTGSKTFADNNVTKQNIGIVSISGGASAPTINPTTDMTATSISIAAGHTLTITGSNKLTLTGAAGTVFSVTGTFNPSTGTVEYTGAGSITVGATTYYDLSFAPTIGANITYTAGGAITCNNSFTSNPNGTALRTLTFNLGGAFNVANTITLNGTGIGPGKTALNTTATNYPVTTAILTNGVNGTLTCNGSTITVTGAGTPFTQSGTFNPNTSTFVYNNDGNVNVTAVTYNNLTLSPAITAPRTYATLGVITLNGSFNSSPTAASAQTLAVNLGGNLTVTGSMTIGGGGAGPAVTALSTTVSNFNITSSSITVNSGSSLTANGSTITITGTGVVFTLSGTFNPGSSTVIYNADGAVTVGATTYNNLQFTPTLTAARIYTGGGVISCTGNFSSNPGGAGGGKILTVNLGGDISAAGTFGITGSGTGVTSLNTTATNYALTAGTLTIAAGSTLTCNASTITLTGTGTPITVSGTLNINTSTFDFEGDGAVSVPVLAYYNLTMTPPMTANRIYTLLGAMTIGNDFSTNPTAATPLILTVNQGGNMTVTNATTFGGGGAGPAITAFDTTGSNFALTSTSLTLNAGSSLTANGSTITVTGTGIPFSASGTFNANSSTFIYNGNGAVTVAATTYNILTFSPAIAAGQTYTGGGAITCNGNFISNPSSAGANTLTFNLGGTFSVTGSITLTGSGAGPARTAMNTTGAGNYDVSCSTLTINALNSLTANSSNITVSGTGTPFTLSGTFNSNTSIFKYTGNAATTMTVATYFSLQALPSTNGIAHTFATGSFTINGNLTAGNGVNTGVTVTAAVNSTTLTVIGDVSISGGTTFIAHATNGFNAGGSWSNSGTFTANGGSITFDPSLAPMKTLSGTMTGTSAFNNVTFNSAVGNWTFSASADVSGNFALSTGSLTAPAGTLTITGNFDNSATFSHNNGTVTFNGTAGTQVIGGTQNTTFFDLSHTTAADIKFGDATTGSKTFTVAGQFTWSAGNMIIGNAAPLLTDTLALTNAAPANSSISIPVGKSITMNGASEIQLRGDWNDSAGTFTPLSGTVTFNGSVNQSITSSGSNNFFNLTINNSGGFGTQITNTTGFNIKNDYTNSSPVALLAASAGTISFSGGAAQAISPKSGDQFRHLTINNLGGGVTASGGFQVAGDFDNAGGTSFSASAGTITFNGSAAQSINKSGAGAITFFSLTINSTGGVTTSVNFDVKGNFDNAGTSNFTASGNTITFDGGVAQTISKTGAGSTTFSNLTLSNTAGGVGGTGSFNVSGTFDNAGATNFAMTGGTATFSGSVAQSINKSGAGSIAFFGLTINNTGGGVSSSVNFNINGNFNNAGATNFSHTGTVTFGGGAAQTISKTGAGTSTFLNLTINNTSGGVAGTGSFNVTGSFDNVGATNFGMTGGTAAFTGIGAQSILKGGAGAITFFSLDIANTFGGVSCAVAIGIAGNFDHSGSTNFGPTGTVTFNGSSAQSISKSGGATLTFGDLTINNSGGPATTVGCTATFTINGTFSNTSTNATLAATAGTTTFGGAAQSITATTPANVNVFNNLTISGTSTTTVSADINVRGTLTVNAGGGLQLGDNRIVQIGTTTASGTVSIAGTLRTTSGAVNKPKVTAANTGFRHAFTVTGTVDVNGLIFEYADSNGMQFSGASVVLTKLDNAAFQNSDVAPRRHISFSATVSIIKACDACSFDGAFIPSSADANVAMNSAGSALYFTNFSGAGAGEPRDYDQDDGGSGYCHWVSAGDKFWAGTTSTSWNTAGNWIPSGVPVPGDNVYIVDGNPNDCTQDIALGTTITNLTIRSAGALTLPNNLTATGNFSVVGGGIVMTTAGVIVAVSGNSTISGNWASTITTGEIRVEGNWDDSAGGWTPTGGTTSFTLGTPGTSTIKQGAGNNFFNLSIGNSMGTIQTSATSSPLDVNGDFTMPGVAALFDPNGIAMEVAGNWDDSGGTFQPFSACTVTFDRGAGTSTISQQLGNWFWGMTVATSGGGIVQSSAAVRNEGNFTITSGGYDPNGFGLSVAGNWDDSGGTFQPAASMTVTLNRSSAGISTAKQGAANFFKNLTISSTLGSHQTDAASSVIDVDGNFTVSGSAIYDPNGIGMEVQGNWDDSAGTFQPTAAMTVTFNRGVGTTTVKQGTGNNFQSVAVATSGGGIVQAAAASAAIDINGSFTITTGTYDPNGIGLEVEGNWDDSAGTFQPASAMTVTLNRSVAGTSTVKQGPLNFFSSLTVANTAGAHQTDATSSPIDINANFTIASGSYDPGTVGMEVEGNWDDSGGTFQAPAAMTVTLNRSAGGTSTVKQGLSNFFGGLTISATFTHQTSGTSAAIDINGAFTITSGTYDPNGISMEVEGNWDDSGGTFQPAATMTVTLNRTLAGTSTVKQGATNFFINVTVNNGAGFEQTNLLSDPIDINGNFTITSGVYDPNGKDMEVEGNWDDSGGTFQPVTAMLVTLNRSVAGTSTVKQGAANNFMNVRIANTAGAHQTDAASAPVNVDGNFTIFSGTYDPNGLGMEIEGNWNDSGGTFQPSSAMTVTFDRSAAGTSTILAGPTNFFRNVTISNVAGSVQISGTSAPLYVNGAFTISAGGGSFDANSIGMKVIGDWSNSGTFIPGTQTVTFDGTTQSISGATTFSSATIAGTSTTTMSANTGIAASLQIDGIFVMADLTTVTMGTGAVSGTINVAGTIRTNSGAVNKPTITSSSASFRYAFSMTGTLDINGLIFDTANASGMAISGATAAITKLDNAAFQNSPAAPRRHISFTATSSIIKTCNSCSFDGAFTPNSTDANVAMNGAGTALYFASASGVGAGEGQDYDVENGGAGFVHWVSAGEKFWVGTTSTSWNTASNWTPSGIPASTDSVVIVDGNTNDPTLDVSPTIMNLTIRSAGMLTISTFTLDVGGNFLLEDGGFNLSAAGTIAVTGNFTVTETVWSSTASAGTISVKGNWDDSSGAFTGTGSNTVNFNRTAAGTSTIKQGATSSFQNMSVSNIAGTIQVTAGSAPIDINGNFAMTAGSFDPNGFSMEVTGNWDDSGGTFVPATSMTVTFDRGIAGTSIVKVGAANNFMNMTIANTAGTVQTDSTSSGIAVEGNFTLSGVLSSFDPNGVNISVRGNWDDFAGTFAPATTMTVLFSRTLAGTSTVKQGLNNFFMNVIVSNTAGAVQTAAGSDAIDINGNFTISTAAGNYNMNGINMEVAGSWNDSAGSFSSASETVTFDGSTAPTLTSSAGNSFFNVVVNKPGFGSSLLLAGGTTVKVNGALTVSDGTLDVTSGTMIVTGNATVSGTGSPELKISSSGTMKMGSGSTLSIGNGTDPGLLTVSGTGTIAKLTTAGTVGVNFYGVTITSTGTVSINKVGQSSGADRFVVESLNANGITINQGAAINDGTAGEMRGMIFQSIAAGGTYVRFLHTTGGPYTFTIKGCSFDDLDGATASPPSYNVSTVTGTTPSIIRVIAGDSGWVAADNNVFTPGGYGTGPTHENDHQAGTDNGSSITYSGTVYANDNDTGPIATTTVRIVINGVDKGTATTDGAGNYSKTLFATSTIDWGVEVGTSGEGLIQYLDNGVSPFGSAATITSGTNIAGMRIYQNNVIIRNDNGGATTNAQIATALGAFSDADIKFSVSAGNLTVSGGHTLYLAGNFTPGGVVTCDETAAGAADGRLKLSSGTLTEGAFTHTIKGNVVIAGGFTSTVAASELDVSGSWDDSLAGFIETNGLVKFNRGAGTSTAKTGTGNTFFNVVIATTGGGSVQIDAGSSDFQVAGNFTISSGTFDPNGKNMVISGNWDDSGGTFTPSSGNVTFSGTGTSNVTALATNGFYDLTISSTVTVVPANALDINNALSMNSGTFTPGAFNHKVGGNLNFSGGNFAPTAGTITFDGAGAQNVLIQATQNFFNFVVSKSAGTLTAGSVLDINGNFTMSSGAFNPGTFNHKVSGNWDDSGGTFIPTSGTVTLDGTSAQSITSAGANNFFDLTISKTTGVAGASSNLNINGALSVSLGTFDPNSNVILLGADSSVSSGAFLNLAGTPTLRLASGITFTINGQIDASGGTIVPAVAGDSYRLFINPTSPSEKINISGLSVTNNAGAVNSNIGVEISVSNSSNWQALDGLAVTFTAGVGQCVKITANGGTIDSKYSTFNGGSTAANSGGNVEVSDAAGNFTIVFKISNDLSSGNPEGRDKDTGTGRAEWVTDMVTIVTNPGSESGTPERVGIQRGVTEGYAGSNFYTSGPSFVYAISGRLGDDKFSIINTAGVIVQEVSFPHSGYGELVGRPLVFPIQTAADGSVGYDDIVFGTTGSGSNPRILRYSWDGSTLTLKDDYQLTDVSNITGPMVSDFTFEFYGLESTNKGNYAACEAAAYLYFPGVDTSSVPKMFAVKYNPAGSSGSTVGSIGLASRAFTEPSIDYLTVGGITKKYVFLGTVYNSTGLKAHIYRIKLDVVGADLVPVAIDDFAAVGAPDGDVITPMPEARNFYAAATAATFSAGSTTTRRDVGGAGVAPRVYLLDATSSPPATFAGSWPVAAGSGVEGGAMWVFNNPGAGAGLLGWGDNAGNFNVRKFDGTSPTTASVALNGAVRSFPQTAINYDKFYIGTDNGGLYRLDLSATGGITGTTMLNFFGTGVKLRDVRIVYLDGVYVSTDKGVLYKVPGQ